MSAHATAVVNGVQQAEVFLAPYAAGISVSTALGAIMEIYAGPKSLTIELPSISQSVPSGSSSTNSGAEPLVQTFTIPSGAHTSIQLNSQPGSFRLLFAGGLLQNPENYSIIGQSLLIDYDPQWVGIECTLVYSAV